MLCAMEDSRNEEQGSLCVLVLCLMRCPNTANASTLALISIIIMSINQPQDRRKGEGGGCMSEISVFTKCLLLSSPTSGHWFVPTRELHKHWVCNWPGRPGVRQAQHKASLIDLKGLLDIWPIWIHAKDPFSHWTQRRIQFTEEGIRPIIEGLKILSKTYKSALHTPKKRYSLNINKKDYSLQFPQILIDLECFALWSQQNFHLTY